MAEGKLVSVGTVLQKHMQMLIGAIKKNLQDDNSIASRRLLQSVRFTPIKILGSKFEVELLMEDYWRYVEHGRKSGKMPPIDAIMKWTVEKGIPIQPISNLRKRKIGALKNRTVKKAFKQVSKDAMRRQRAFLIARAIAKKGIKPTLFLSKAVNDDFKSKLEADIREQTGKEIKVQLTQALQ